MALRSSSPQERTRSLSLSPSRCPGMHCEQPDAELSTLISSMNAMSSPVTSPFVRSNLCSPERAWVEVNHNGIGKYFASHFGESNVCRVFEDVIIAIFCRLELDDEDMRYASLRDGQANQHVELKEVPEVMVLSYLISFRTVVQPAHDRFHIRFVCCGGHAPVLKRKHLLAHL